MMSNLKLTIISDDTQEHYYEIEIWKDNTIWINNQEGEGMGISTKRLYDDIHKWFRENH